MFQKLHAIFFFDVSLQDFLMDFSILPNFVKTS